MKKNKKICILGMATRSIQKAEKLTEKMIQIPPLKLPHHKLSYLSGHIVSVYDNISNGDRWLCIAVYSFSSGIIDPERKLGKISIHARYEIVSTGSQVVVLVTDVWNSQWYHISYTDRCIINGVISHIGRAKAYFVKDSHFNIITPNKVYEYFIGRDQVNQKVNTNLIGMEVQDVVYDIVRHTGLIMYTNGLKVYIGKLQADGGNLGKIQLLNSVFHPKISTDGRALVEIDEVSQLIKISSLKENLETLRIIEVGNYVENILLYSHYVIVNTPKDIQIYIRNKTHIITIQALETQITENVKRIRSNTITPEWLVFSSSTCSQGKVMHKCTYNSTVKASIMDVVVSAIASTIASTLRPDIFMEIVEVSYQPPEARINLRGMDYYKVETTTCTESVYSVIYGTASLLGIPIPSASAACILTLDDNTKFVHLLYKYACYAGTPDESELIMQDISQDYPKIQWIYPKVTDDCDDIVSCNSTELLSFYKYAISNIAIDFVDLIHNVSCKTLWGEINEPDLCTSEISKIVETAAGWCNSMLHENLVEAARITGMSTEIMGASLHE